MRLPAINKILGFKHHADDEGTDQEHSRLFYLIGIIYVASLFRINAATSSTLLLVNLGNLLLFGNLHYGTQHRHQV
jgi:hypothetical protein